MSFDYPYFLLMLGGLYFVFKNGYTSNTVLFAPLGWSMIRYDGLLWKEKIIVYAERIAYILIILGLSGPNLNLERDSINMDGIDLAITLDLSASMQAADFSPNRLEAMKELVKEYLKETRGNRTSIVVFSGKVFLHYPFTNNKNALISAIDSIHFQTIDHNKAGGTNIGDAILFSVQELLKVKVKTREQAILVITDGENTGGIDPFVSAKTSLKSDIHLYIVGLAGENPIPVFESDGDPFIGADGKQVITSLNDSSLKEIAASGGGVYYRAKEGNSLASILREIGDLEKHPLDVKKVTEKVSLSLPVSFLGAISFFIFFFGTGIWLRRPVR